MAHADAGSILGFIVQQESCGLEPRRRRSRVAVRGVVATGLRYVRNHEVRRENIASLRWIILH